MNNLAKEIVSSGARLTFDESGGYRNLNIRGSGDDVVITIDGHHFHATKKQAKAIAAYIHACSEAAE